MKYRTRFYMVRLTLALAALALCGILITLAVIKLRQPTAPTHKYVNMFSWYSSPSNTHMTDHVANGKVRHSARQVLRDL